MGDGGWGGARKGAGRKPKLWRRSAPHARREVFRSRQCLLVTMHLEPGLPSLRGAQTVAVLKELLRARATRPGFSVAAWTLQRNHCHMIVEAEDSGILALGMQCLSTRIARALNRLWGRQGDVFQGRFDSRVLRITYQVRDALRYVLLNHKKHSPRSYGSCIDPASSGPWFDGWLEAPDRPMEPAPVAEPRSWLLKTGWRSHGLISVFERPGEGKVRFVEAWPICGSLVAGGAT